MTAPDLDALIAAAERATRNKPSAVALDRDVVIALCRVVKEVKVDHGLPPPHQVPGMCPMCDALASLDAALEGRK